jgi:ABC-type transport system involved in multi-copper enzyme maturation permease subunit
MTTGLISIASDAFNPIRLIGPIFDKELRVSSRRRRNYLLRVAYIALLSVFILSAWYSAFGIRSSGSAAYQVSRLSQMGRIVITTVVWFQFVAAQFIAAVMLSSSISDEVRSGTLGVLMTTPISSFQIVTGKLLGKLLQLMLLLATSLPMLAIIRVFGGVPWDYLISSVCITLTAAILVGALSLLFSMLFRRAHNVIILIIVVYLLLFAALPGMFIWIAAEGSLSQQVTSSVIALTNPFWALMTSTRAMLLPQGGTAGIFLWPVHCLIMLAVTAFLITISVWRARRAALREVFGRPAKLWFRRVFERKGSRRVENAHSRAGAGSIKPVTGSPIVWKEMRKGFIGGKKLGVRTSALLIGLCVLVTISPIFVPRGFIFFPYLLLMGLYLIVMIRMAVFSAGGITVEKETRTWPILLATPLEDKEIVRGKAIAAFRRNLPLLLLYFALSCIFFITVGNIPGRNMLSQIMGMLILAVSGLVCSVLFVIGSGLYFGMRFRSTTAAVAATVGSYLMMKYFFGISFRLFSRLFFGIALGGGMIWIYYATSVLNSLILGGVGVSLGLRAVRRVRRDIF